MEKNKFNIKFTKSAFNDLDEIYLYIKNELHADKSAENISHKIQYAIENLKTFPESGPLIQNILFNKRNYRKLIVGNYIIIYKIIPDKKEIIIMRIVYATRNYIEIL